MKAIQYSSYAGADGLTLVEAPKPTPQSGEVLVKIHAAGVNPVDIAVSEGFFKDFRPMSFPITAGSEMAGVIEAVGSDVKNFAVGDAVHATLGSTGAFAEYVAVEVSKLARKPARMSFVEAAGLPVAAATATVALNTGNVERGTKLLIHAAAGGVGSVAVQMAKARGAEVTALASAGNIEFVKTLGADRVVDRASRYEDSLRDFDVVLDAFGPPAQERSWSLLRKGGVLVSLVTQPSEETAAKYGVRAVRIFGMPTGEVLAQADALVDAGKLKVHVSRTYPLAQAADALREVASGRVRGKLVLTVV
jgi:NADPH:quinone reductase-like Zn-dependent oxidoreductase